MALLDDEDLAFMRETQAEARPTEADLRRAIPGASDGMGGVTEAQLGDPEPIMVRVYRNMNLQSNTVPATLGEQYGANLVKLTTDLVNITTGSTVTTATRVYEVVSGSSVEDWDTAQVVWAVER